MDRVNWITKDKYHTKNRILLESARLFASHGYHAVSVRDIAEAVGITAGSIYSHYTGKQEILNNILDHADYIISLHYQRLEHACTKATSLEAVLENMFLELGDTSDIFAYYGISILTNRMLEYDKAREILLRLFYKGGCDRIKAVLDETVLNGLAMPFDTTTVSELIINTMIAYNSLGLAENEGIETDIDLHERYKRACSFFIRAVSQGI